MQKPVYLLELTGNLYHRLYRPAQNVEDIRVWLADRGWEMIVAHERHNEARNGKAWLLLPNEDAAIEFKLRWA